MTYYPYNKDLLEASGSRNNFDKFKNGNFGLWYNKYIPLKSVDNPKTSDSRGNDNEAVKYYKEMYKTNVDKLLSNKHLNQLAFCERMTELGYKIITINAKLKTPLLTGIGESHPHEISLVFEHTLGIPYIPATGIKGISRLSYILNGILDDSGKILKKFNKEKIDLKEVEGFLKTFGFSEKEESERGDVVFLDSYPIKTPKLKIDVMTPHYGDYYSDDTKPPADNMNPTPIKFLTVKEGTDFVFRVIVKKADIEKTKKAIKRALTEEGIGAKTALGYGYFEIIKENETDEMKQKYSEWLEKQLSPEERERREKAKKENKLKEEKKKLLEKIRPELGQSEVSTLFNDWEKIFNKDKEIAKKILAVGIVNSKKKKDKKNKKGPKVFSANYIKIAEVLGLPLD